LVPIIANDRLPPHRADMNSPTPIAANPPAPADAWVSMRHLQRAMVFMKSQGMPCDELLLLGNLTSEQLADGDKMVPLSTIETILSAAQRRYNDPMLGLRMADDIQPSTLGALGFVLQACATLGDLVDVAVRFNGLMSNIGHTSVTHSPGLVEIRWDCRAGTGLLRRHACEYILGTFVVLTRLLAPGVPGPVAVQFPHPRPEPAERVRTYFDFFGCPVHFGQAHASIITSASRLQWRLPHGDAVLKDLLERHAQHLLNRRTRSSSLTEDVSRLLQALILTGTPTKEAVAQQLGTSARSLHRRLEAENTSYGEQLDAVRLNLAREQLGIPDTPIADIAERLGFSSPQAFMRWFKQLVGATPGQYRSGLPAL
jgi:AraC-like DNA-binding protein